MTTTAAAIVAAADSGNQSYVVNFKLQSRQSKTVRFVLTFPVLLRSSLYLLPLCFGGVLVEIRHQDNEHVRDMQSKCDVRALSFLWRLRKWALLV